MKKRSVLKIGSRMIGILLYLCVLGCSSAKQTEPVLLAPVAVKHDTEIVARGDLFDTVAMEGVVRPEIQELFFIRKDASLLQIHVLPGDRVKAGDVLAELDMQPIHDSISELRESIVHMEKMNEYEVKLQDLEIATEKLHLSNLDGKLSKETSPYSRKQLENSMDEIRFRIEKLELAKKQEAERFSRQLENENVKLNQLIEQTKDATIVAPFGGEIIYVDTGLQKGSRVEAYRPVLFIADLNALYIQHTGIESISHSSPYEYTAYINGKSYDISLIEEDLQDMIRATLEGRKLERRFRFEAQEDLSGMDAGDFVVIYEQRQMKPDTIFIPVNALYVDSSAYRTHYVYVLENGSKTRREVKPGLRTSIKIEILEGLSEGEEIFVKQ